MAHPSNQSLCSGGFLRCVLVLLILFLVAVFWHVGKDSIAQASCPSCGCDCSSDIFSKPLDCGKNDAETKEELEKDAISLIAEELSFLINVTADNLKRTNSLIADAKRTSSHYQKEVEKCNTGMESCEGAREKAAAKLIEERKLCALWEERARERGWKDERRIYT